MPPAVHLIPGQTSPDISWHQDKNHLISPDTSTSITWYTRTHFTWIYQDMLPVVHPIHGQLSQTDHLAKSGLNYFWLPITVALGPLLATKIGPPMPKGVLPTILGWQKHLIRGCKKLPPQINNNCLAAKSRPLDHFWLICSSPDTK